MAECFCGCGRRVRFGRGAPHKSGRTLSDELRFWQAASGVAEQVLGADALGESFLTTGEGYRSQLAAIVHGERELRDLDQRALRRWLHDSLELRANLGFRFETLPRPITVDPAAGERELEEFVEQISSRLKALLERRLRLRGRPDGDPVMIAASCVLRGGGLLGISLNADAARMPIGEPDAQDVAREAFRRRFAGERTLIVGLFLAAALTHPISWELRLLEVEEGEQSGHEFWAQLHGLIAEHLPEREQARLVQCDAAFRAIAEEPGAAPAIEVYPTPELAAFDRRSARARPR